MVLPMYLRMVLSIHIFFANVTLGILPSRGYVIWRYSVSSVEFNVRALKQSLHADSDWAFYSRVSLFVAPH